MPRTKKSDNGRPIDSYAHTGKQRLNNPPVGFVTADTDPDEGRKTYMYDPHLDPQLTWAGKAEHTSFEVPTVSLHVHERIDPRIIVEAVQRAPDPNIRLASGDVLVLETKGQDTEQDRVKRRYLDEWVQAVNQQGGFGHWRWDVAMQPGDVLDILVRRCVSGPGKG